MQEALPFTNTSVDFARPLYVKNSGGAESKMWVALYTCCVTRAIYLDLVPDSLLLVLFTFQETQQCQPARRGLPALMILDIGKTFEAAAKVIKNVISNPVGIEWKFNIPRVPWWGGIFEKLACAVNEVLLRQSFHIRYYLQ